MVGGHVEGRLWLVDGRLVASQVGKSQDHVDAMFELLRLPEGNFVFKDGIEAPAPEEPAAVEPVMDEAEARLKEWQAIQLVVPSPEHRVRLIADLPAPEVTLTAEKWHLVMAVAQAATVRGVIDELALSQFEGCRGIKGLVDAGLVVVEAPRVRPSASDPARLARRSAPNGSLATGDDSPRLAHAVRRPVQPSLVLPAGLLADLHDESDPYDESGLTVGGTPPVPAAMAPETLATLATRSAPRHPGPEPQMSPFSSSGFGHQLRVVPSEDEYLPRYGETGELATTARQPAHEGNGAAVSLPVSPVAPVAPVAASPAPPRVPAPEVVDEPETGVADRQERDPAGDSINRGLLLKFLSSVRS